MRPHKPMLAEWTSEILSLALSQHDILDDRSIKASNNVPAHHGLVSAPHKPSHDT